MNDVTIASERAKYEAAWDDCRYRKYSPGEKAVDDFLAWRQRERTWRRTEGVVADLGCGTGRAGLALAAAGYRVHMVDLADNCLDPDVAEALGDGLTFHRGCLWADKLPRADLGFCCDVLEHLPPERVAAALDNIASALRIACYFRVHCGPDCCGELIGVGPLHLTVEPWYYWRMAIAERWVLVEERVDGDVYVAKATKTREPRRSFPETSARSEVRGS